MNARRNISNQPSKANTAKAVAVNYFPFDVAFINRPRVIKPKEERIGKALSIPSAYAVKSLMIVT
jgi:hypothetical protein